MASNSNRMNKIDEEIKKEISTIISTELKNPHLTGLISVSKVKTTPDLRFAKVYVTMINEKSKKENLSILKQSSGYIRSAIAKKINLRYTPELVFEFDESIEYGSRIDEILKDITDMENESQKLDKKVPGITEEEYIAYIISRYNMQLESLEHIQTILKSLPNSKKQNL